MEGVGVDHEEKLPITSSINKENQKERESFSFKKLSWNEDKLKIFVTIH